MPYTFEFPGVLRSIVPLVRREWFPGFRRSVVNEFIAFAFGHPVRAFQFLGTAAGRIPAFATVIRALNNLPKPPTRLRCIDTLRINRRTFHVINLPARKLRAAHFPTFARAIRSQNERAFSCADQYSYVAHDLDF